jgi:Flp pilus assembly pilin Flp
MVTTSFNSGQQDVRGHEDSADFRPKRNKIDAPCWPVARFGCGRLEMLTITLQLLRATLRDRAGVSSLEYGVLAVGIVAAVATAVGLLGADFTALFQDVGAAITAAVTQVKGT